MLTGEDILARAGIDAVALKPAECDVSRARDLPVGTVTVDWEGPEHLPARDTLRALADEKAVRVTTPVRADGFDPLGDDSLYEQIPREAGQVLVAGHPAYLDDEERERAVAPRLGAARERAPEAWVGTEGIERVALAAGGTQFALLSGTTERDLRALRAAGFEGGLAVYAPTVLADDEDAVLDAVGAYVARRKPVREALQSHTTDPSDAPDTPDAPDAATDGGATDGPATDAGATDGPATDGGATDGPATDADATDGTATDGTATDSTATGHARDVLLWGAREYALVGSPPEVREHTDALRAAGADTVVGYPARGLDAFLE